MTSDGDIHRAARHKHARPWIRQAAQAVAARRPAVHGIVLSDVGRSLLGLKQLKSEDHHGGARLARRKVDTAVYVRCAVQLRRRQT